MPSFTCMPFFACNRQIDAIDRRQCNLQQIPGDLERYARSLEELLLDMNHINFLPKSLFRLQRLQRLGLSDNDIHRLPPEISALQNLVELNLSRNDISDLPEQLKICHNLQMLDISSNPIARLPDSITLCTSLSQLSLNDISLTKLPQDIGKLQALKSLEVRENHLRALPQSISALVHLQRLDLGQNELDDLPNEIGCLRSLQELYLDENSVEKLPDAILQCSRLEQLDLTSNRLFQLPDGLGDLGCLMDLNVSHNCLRELPSSLGRLKRLLILKADDNMIDSLTPAIGGCTNLNELYLQQNPISELPSSIGNLRWLQILNLDRCQLRQLPALIGECQSLNVLQIRHNQLEELPMEIGKLSKLRVFDVSNNMLNHLPYTLNVLRELRALWLSENQSQALLRLQQDTDTRTGIKVLTCYLLPQHSAEKKASEIDASNLNKSTGFIETKVHFVSEEKEEGAHCQQSLSDADGSNFEKRNAPYPKTEHPVGPTIGNEAAAAAALAASKHHKKQQVDGHIVPKMEEHPKSIVLSGSVKKMSQDHSAMHNCGPSTSTAGEQTRNQQQNPLPRSALKYPSQPSPLQQPPIIELQKSPKAPQQKQQRNVIFNNEKGAKTDVPQSECRLKRVNTPHYKSQRAAAAEAAEAQKNPQQAPSNRRQLPKIPSTSEQPPSTQKQQKQQSNASSTHFAVNIVKNDDIHIQSINEDRNGGTGVQMERKRVIVRRGDCGAAGSAGLGLTIAGGIESTPFLENDPGIFISKLVPGGVGERSGLRAGDKVLEINGISMIGKRHQIAVNCIQQRVAELELLIERRRNALQQKA